MCWIYREQLKIYSKWVWVDFWRDAFLGNKFWVVHDIFNTLFIHFFSLSKIKSQEMQLYSPTTYIYIYLIVATYYTCISIQEIHKIFITSSDSSSNPHRTRNDDATHHAEPHAPSYPPHHPPTWTLTQSKKAFTPRKLCRYNIYWKNHPCNIFPINTVLNKRWTGENLLPLSN